jgi:hypothetical protein
LISVAYVNQHQKFIFKNKKAPKPRSRPVRPRSKPTVITAPSLPWWSPHPRHVELKEAVLEREGDENVVVAAVDLAAGVCLLEGDDDDGGVPAGEVVTGVGQEADLVVGDGLATM